MKEGQPKAIYLKDYQPPAYYIRTAYLHFKLGEECTEVTADYYIERNPQIEGVQPLILQGEQLELSALSLDGQQLSKDAYTVDESALIVHQVPSQFALRVSVRIRPQLNTQLEGLYKSSGNFCTQCEAEGFRKIVYFMDRPDVLAIFTVRIEARKQLYPVLLSNGNCQEAGDLEDGMHYTVWHDPFPKPCYLFALVAGKLACKEGRFTTGSGRQVALQLFVEPHNVDRCEHALASLQKAMQWDEQVFGLEYDLDVYMIVAVDDFNMGAMENKGLNIFNSKCVLASPETATDMDYQTIEAVIAHEYFHNWTGNRVTCRDWFQLSLKEGLTVYRDQEFTADVTSRAVKRIRDVRLLRSHQFVEDAGPMAHPVRPDSFIEINNFYTVTVYEKGAEIVRMYETLFGKEGFRRGMDLYFQRHDGQAVTTDDFAAAMAQANDFELGNFMGWYSQAGTPRVEVSDHWDAECGEYTLHMTQSYPSIHGLPERDSVLIPVRVGLLGADGQDLHARLGDGGAEGNEFLLLLAGQQQTFHFSGLLERPIPSLLRGFSAPVRLDFDYTDEQLALLMSHDSDPFNRWEAGQRLATRCLLDAVSRIQAQQSQKEYDDLIEAYRKLLIGPINDPAQLAEMIRLPEESYLAEMISPIDVNAVYLAREWLKQQVATKLRAELQEVYQQNRPGRGYRYHALGMGRRSLCAACLQLLAISADQEAISLVLAHYSAADNMTDKISALQSLNNMDCPEREEVFAHFEQEWMDDALVLDKWFALQAQSRLPKADLRIGQLLAHRKFSLANPNRVRAVIGTFVQANPTGFHARDGSGYHLLATQVIALDKINPQIAARLVKALIHWRKYDQQLQQLQTQELRRIKAQSPLSDDVYELVARSLAD